jgi:hypothetical protein
MKLTIAEAQNILEKQLSYIADKVEIELPGPSVEPAPPAPHGGILDNPFNENWQKILRILRDNSEKILAIRIARELHPGYGLADAKNYVERL